MKHYVWSSGNWFVNVAVTSEVVLFVCECGRDTMYGSRDTMYGSIGL